MKLLKSKELIITAENELVVFDNEYDVLGLKFIPSMLKPLQKFQETIGPVLFDDLLRRLESISKGLIGYKSAENLKVLAGIVERKIIVISVGEYQPHLYRLYVEGVYELDAEQE